MAIGKALVGFIASNGLIACGNRRFATGGRAATCALENQSETHDRIRFGITRIGAGTATTPVAGIIGMAIAGATIRNATSMERIVVTITTPGAGMCFRGIMSTQASAGIYSTARVGLFIAIRAIGTTRTAGTSGSTLDGIRTQGIITR